MEKKPVYWVGPTSNDCDINPNHRIVDTFIDGKTIFGSWANMCPNCHLRIGVGLGTGRGQKYKKQADNGRWLKVEG